MAVEQNKSHATNDGMFSWIQINRKYFRTFPGILKIVELMLGVLCLILATPAISVINQWFSYVIIISIVVTALWCFIYLLSAKEAISFPINWPLTEMLNMAFLAIIIAIASVFQISYWIGAHFESSRWKNIFAGIFGIVDCLLYLITSYVSCSDWRQTHVVNP